MVGLCSLAAVLEAQGLALWEMQLSRSEKEQTFLLVLNLGFHLRLARVCCRHAPSCCLAQDQDDELRRCCWG